MHIEGGVGVGARLEKTIGHPSAIGAQEILPIATHGDELEVVADKELLKALHLIGETEQGEAFVGDEEILPVEFPIEVVPNPVGEIGHCRW